MPVNKYLSEQRKVTYVRKGWTIKKAKKQADRVRRLDVGRPKYHYINVYYKNNKLLATTYHRGKKP